MPNHQYHQTQNDQAAGLRRIMSVPKPRIVSILSASPAQDQVRMVTNLTASICGQGNDVLIMHASQESSEASYEISHLPSLLDVTNKKSSLSDAIRSSSHGYFVAKLMQKNQFNLPLHPDISEQLNHIFEQLARQYEIVMVDATLNANHLLPLKVLNESEILIQLTRRPESIKHAYTLIKKIYSQLGRRSFGIIVEGATDAQAQLVFSNISQVAKRFMQINLEFFGAIPSDEHLSHAAKLGRSVIEAFPLATASNAFKEIALRLNYKHRNVVNIEEASLI